MLILAKYALASDYRMNYSHDPHFLWNRVIWKLELMSEESIWNLSKMRALFHAYLEVFPKDIDRLNILNEQFEQGDVHLTSRKNMTGHLTSSALVFNPETAKVLLIYHKTLKRWLQPGGHLNSLEDPACGAMRELEEETGISSLALHEWHCSRASSMEIPIDIDSHRIPANQSKREGEHLHHDFQYILLQNIDLASSKEKPSSIRLDLSEVDDYRYVDLHQLEKGHFGSRLQRVAIRMGSFSFQAFCKNGSAGADFSARE